MNAITNLFKKRSKPAFEATPLAEPSTLENLISQLEPWGAVRLGQYGSRDKFWCCTVEVNVAPAGARFEVSSGHKNETPTDAARLCLERLRDAVAALRGKA